MIVYHTTEQKSLKSIKKQGLKLGYDGKLYFADSLESAHTWRDILEEDIEVEKMIILKVKIFNKDLIINSQRDGNIKEIIYMKSIKPKYIKEMEEK